MWWNVVNPASKKPKIGRGTLTKELEWSKGQETVDKCLPPSNRYRTWLIRF